ncbi:putative pentatricopeptide repeat-containing protein At5g43820 [Vicia villosa]|uniref:putative pentatricopeptide repeat-containing protein At5g43820 n=1 Tax=Vicia villosa TaxID=3911 RepID=UPI00273A85E5|nr:putative pentatricopeptide repeat-containing protein At5g43820 [Vicia villosa]XP_058780212.1 putative pentatricopeptide repeat-containing protein At5g43820 [Vicia villosa]XP_058780213.1 putative pentatricopeptide repeat-containing protein At5g43820 [Vicia villosa]XP_058780214.1 putative pentatricopeptide repeat-containing protein At5g43820 [Vicia villosa]XP_058780215.1 putative pentatricopeptide repeat-containing protein At5g43820 [Vicia villosa]XP_058780217.1 putative pentatricopeptide rep
MAFRSLGLKFALHLSKPISSLLPLHQSISSLQALPTSPHLDERLILHQISQLLPIPSSKTLESESESKSKSVDGFLSPEDKLRGIFLQKLKGKAAIEQALSNVCIDVNVDIIARVLNSGNLSGEAMVTFFNWALKQPMVPKDVGTYHVIVKALGRRKFLVFMMQVLDDMRLNCIKADLFMLSIVIDSFVNAGHVSKAIHVFGNLDDLGLERDTEALNVLLSCLCRRSHVGAAASVFNSMKGKVAFNVATYNVVAGGWCKSGRVDEIERVMKEMEVEGFSPDFGTFAFLLEGLGRAGRMNEAVEVFGSMKEKDTTTYNAMIFNFISIGNFDECMKYYNGMLSDNCEPNIDTYTRMISAFLRIRKVADALLMFDEMLRQGVVPPAGTVTSFIKYLCSYGPPYAAMMIYKKARKLECKISMEAYKILLMRLSKYGKCGTLLSVWQEMQECGYSSDVEVYEYIITGLYNIGQLETAVLVMEEALRKGFCPSRLVYSKLSNKLLASNLTERAYRLFLKIKHARSLKNARSYWRHNGWHF